jgi:hypothetical protein
VCVCDVPCGVHTLIRSHTMLHGCPAEGEERQTLHQGEQCHCGARKPGTGSSLANTSGVGRSHAAGHVSAGWGLPTYACPATPYLLDEYPALHRRWLEEGRVLVHCSTSGGFGDYLRSIPSVVVLSMLLELALVLQCDVPVFDPLNPHRELRLHTQMPRMFFGPHIEWTRRVRLTRNDSTLAGQLAGTLGEPPPGAEHTQHIVGKYTVLHELSAQQMRSYSRARSSTRVYSNAFTVSTHAAALSPSCAFAYASVRREYTQLWHWP